VIFFFTKGLIDVTQTVYNGTAGNDYLDASAEGAKDIAVFRAAAGSDTCIGGAGADRFDGGAGADSMFGGGGNDAFFIARDNTTGGARDSIDGGTGTDLLNIVMSTYQVTDAVKAEIARLDAYLTGDITQHFVSDLFHVDMVNVETANIRLDGVVKTLAAVAPPANHAAGIAGTATGSVTEDGGLVASGTLAVTDADAGQAAFQAVAAGSLAQTYGSFSFDAATGAWGYALNNTAANVQALTAAQTVTDTLHVTSRDGTAGQDITVSIRGADEAATNHAATITGTYTGAVTENDTLAFYGHLTVTDADAGQAGLQTIAIADQAKTYGQFSVNFTNGNWSYTLNNNAANVQALTAAQTVTDTLHVTSRDGTAGQDITVSIHGADGAPVPVTIGFEAFAENTSAGGGAFSLQEAGFVFTTSYGYVVDAAFLASRGKGVSANGGQALQTTLGTTITRADHGDFALDSLMNRLWEADDTVTIQGFHAGTKIYETTVSGASWHTDTLNWTGLDEVKIDT
jgi:VCBS repeat-containing protein